MARHPFKERFHGRNKTGLLLLRPAGTTSRLTSPSFSETVRQDMPSLDSLCPTRNPSDGRSASSLWKKKPQDVFEAVRKQAR